MNPGEYLLDQSSGGIEANRGRRTSRVLVKNSGDRPIQVGSHYHFFETNAALFFDRESAYGMRLNIASGTAVRFEPGEEKEVELTEVVGNRIIRGFNALVESKLDAAGAKARALGLAQKNRFLLPDKGNKR